MIKYFIFSDLIFDSNSQLSRRQSDFRPRTSSLSSSFPFTRVCIRTKVNGSWTRRYLLYTRSTRVSLPGDSRRHLLPSASLCYGQFCILPTLPYLFSFSLFLSRALIHSRPPSRRHPRAMFRSSRLLFLSSRTGREERTGEMSRQHGRSKYFTVSCIGGLSPSPPPRESFPAQILAFRGIDNKKMYTRNSFGLLILVSWSHST